MLIRESVVVASGSFPELGGACPVYGIEGRAGVRIGLRKEVRIVGLQRCKLHLKREDSGA
jgi:hypothetical protein